MAAKKLYDAAVKTGEYTDGTGQTRGRYENIGAVLQSDNGPYLMLKRTFNPAGVPSDRDSIIVSLFKPKEEGQQTGNNQRQQGAQQQSQPAYNASSHGTAAADLDDDVPF